MKQITDDEQKRIFSKNLSYFLSINNIQQNDFAKAIGVQPSTVTNWIKQTGMPQVSTIQKIADFFRVGKSDLIDEKLDEDPGMAARIVSDDQVMEMIKMYYLLSISDREIIFKLITSLYEKTKR